MDLSNLTSKTTSMANDVQSTINSDDFDASDPAQLLALQQQLAQYQEFYGTLSAVISDMKTTAMSIIQKM